MGQSRNNDKKHLNIAASVIGSSVAAGVVGNLNILGWLKIMQTKKPSLIIGSGIAATGFFAATNLALYRAHPAVKPVVTNINNPKEEGMPFIARKMGLSS